MRVRNLRVRDAVPLSFSTGKVLLHGEQGLEIEPCEGGVMLRDTRADKGPKTLFVPVSNIVCMEVVEDQEKA